MRLLLDTHVLLWTQQGNPRIRPGWLLAIDEAEAVFVSAATIWEVAIKRSRGRLDAPADVGAFALASGYLPLPITWAHGEAAGWLPPYHADPFDRVLIAQARLEGLTLVTSDAMIARYDVTIL